MHRSKRWIKLIPWMVVLVAFALRLYRLDTQSFAFDEGWTSYAIHYSWQEMWAVLAPDNHPPLYYVLVKALAEVAGYGDLSTRFLSVLCGTALVALLYTLGKRLRGEAAGLAAALFAAGSPSLIYYAQEARMYSLLMVLVALSSYSLVRIGDNARDRRWWVVYVLAMSGALYTQYFAAVLLLAHNVIWLLWSAVKLLRRERLFVFCCARWWALGQAAILLLYLPWLPTAIRQVSIGQGTWWRMSLPASVILQDMWRFFILGPRRPMGVPLWGPWIAPTSLAVLVAALIGWLRRTGPWAFVLALLALPAAVTVWGGSHFSIYTDRYTLAVLPGLALVVGTGVSACWEALPGRRAWLGRLAAGSLLAASLAGPLPQLYAYYHDPTYWREDFRRAAQYLMDQSAPGDTAILIGSYQPIMQYYHGAATVLRFPQRGDSIQSEEEVVSLLQQSVRPGHQVRVVMFSWPTVDPQNLVEGQLRAHCEAQGEHWQTDTGQSPIRVLNFAACDSGFAVEPRQPVDAVWDDQVALSAYRLDSLAPGRRGYVVLWWQTRRRPDRDFTVFVHLLDARGEKIAQFDKLPLSDFYPMRTWPLNVDQRDAYPLKIGSDISLEGAWLAIGLYDHQTGRRLPVSQDGIPVGDFLRLPLAEPSLEQMK